jgi:DNA ligase-1
MATEVRDLADGESCEAKGSGAKPYIIKNSGGVYHCTCIAWRNQKVSGPRTCKHIKLLRGEAAEELRIAGTIATPKTVEQLEAEAAKGRTLTQREKAALFGPPLLLAMTLAEVPKFKIEGSWLSEKLDGVRAYWDGTQFKSKAGNVFQAPAWFTQGMPSHPLDGELWLGRGMFQRTLSMIRNKESADWIKAKYVTFDVPHLTVLTFEDRQLVMQASHVLYAKPPNPAAWIMLAQRLCAGRADMDAELARVVAAGGEGVMLRAAGSEYEVGESATLIKVKLFSDTEATVIGYTNGKGKNKGLVGAITLKMPSGQEFDLNLAKDEDRAAPPPIGSIVTYKFSGLTDDGLPKCTGYIGPREDQ